MAYATGTAQNERDLLDKINRFLTADPTLVGAGQGWEVLFDRRLPATPTTVEKRQIAWKSSGTGTDQDIYVCAQTDNSIAQDTYNINFYGGTYFNPDLITATDITPGMVDCSPGVGLCCDSRNFEYHLIASGRRFILANFVAEVCSTAYIGFVLPPVPPTEYPYPLLVAGTTSADRLTRYSTNDNRISSIFDARDSNCNLLGVDQHWHVFSGPDWDSKRGSDTQLILPKAAALSWYSAANTLKYLGACPGGEYPLYQVELLSVSGSPMGASRWGALDGVYWLPGMQLLPGDKIAIAGGRQGIVFHNGQRRNTDDYFMVEII